MSPGWAKSDDGVILVLWAIGITALAGILALALDWGNAVQTATNAQNAADAAAIAGVQGLLSESPVTAGLQATAEAQSVASSYGYTTNQSWESCNPPLGFLPATQYNCVAFSTDSAGYQVIWVEIPAQSIPSLFGSKITVDRFAYAVISSPGQGELCYMTPAPGSC